MLDSFVSFTPELCKVFDHPVQGQEATKRLLSLRQGAQSVAALSVDFHILASESGWNEQALIGVFIKSLLEKLKDELASWDEPKSLEDLISLAIRIDNRLRERNRERYYAPEEPMQLGRAQLTPSERQRRVNQRLCIYCGQAGHYLASCPSAPKGKAHQ